MDADNTSSLLSEAWGGGGGREWTGNAPEEKGPRQAMESGWSDEK